MGQAACAASPGTDRLAVVQEAGDGDCLFHALARQLLGDASLAQRARQEICQWMEQHLLPSQISSGHSNLSAFHRAEIQREMSDIVDLHGDDGPILKYINKMRQPGEWGSGLEALCAAYLYSRPVSIWRGSEDSLHGPPAATIEPPGVSGQQPVGLLHVGGNHWNSVLLAVNQTGGAAAAYKVSGQPPPTAAEIAADRAFQLEAVPDARHDPTRDEEQRRIQRDRVAARYEAAQLCPGTVLDALQKKYSGADQVEGLLTCLRTLSAYLNNLATNPQDPKFQRINRGNSAFQNRIEPYPEAITFLSTVGFIDDGGYLVMRRFVHAKPPCLGDVMQKLDTAIRSVSKEVEKLKTRRYCSNGVLN